MISMDKQYRTRDGREVRIYAVDGIHTKNIHGAIKQKDGWAIKTWQEDGCNSFMASLPDDLIEVKPRIKREYWVNVYPDKIGQTYNTKEGARKYDERNSIACVKITIDCEEGEGL